MSNANSLYIWQRKTWPSWQFDASVLAARLAEVYRAQGRVAARMEALGFALRDHAMLQITTEDVIKTSEIEGDILSLDAVRSSVAQRLGVDIGALSPSDRNVDGIVNIVLDATGSYQQPLTQKKLLAWHADLFPAGGSRFNLVRAGEWRNDSRGPMQVVSGAIGRQKIHFEAPPADSLRTELKHFLTWFNGPQAIDPVIKAGIAHLWFVTLHPFDDGNGRIARAVCYRALAIAERSGRRFYSLSAQIQRERKDYYVMLERIQKGTMDITEWLSWFLECLHRAILGADQTVSVVLAKAEFWRRWAGTALNARQSVILNRLLNGFDGKMTTSKWASIAKCSPDSALRDANDLIEKGLLRKSESGGRSTSYELSIDW